MHNPEWFQTLGRTHSDNLVVAPRVAAWSRTLRSVALLSLIATVPLSAQRRSTTRTSTTPTPESVAESMFAKRASATETATTLKDTYRQGAGDVLRILTSVGYRHTEVASVSLRHLDMKPAAAASTLRSLDVSADVVAGALADTRTSVDVASNALRSAGFSARQSTGAVADRFGVSAYDVYQSLRDAGYSVTDLTRAVTDLGLPVEMECLTEQNSPAPCGDFGQGNNEPVMGQVSWSPSGSHETGGVVTFQSTNIPTVQVYLGEQLLEVIEMTPSRVRARLPQTAQVGDLVFRRVSDGVTGLIEASYAVVAPDPFAGLDWSKLGAEAFSGAMEDADTWISTSTMQASSCTVLGLVATAGPGVLRNDGGFDGNIETRLKRAGAPDELAEAWQSEFEEAFLSWSDFLTIPSLPLYPTFGAFPGPVAPPTQNVPLPVMALASSRANEMSSKGLEARLSKALPGTGAAGARAAIGSFSVEFGTKFANFLSTAIVVNLLGTGPVPSFDAPKVPVGPVVGGECFSSGMWTIHLPSGTSTGME